MILLISVLVSGCSAGYSDPDRCAGVAVATVARAGIARADITRLVTTTNVAGEANLISDIQTWMSVRQCPRGSIIVQMTTSCVVQTVYTQGGCRIPGVRSY
jgi:hypothetical protein